MTFIRWSFIHSCFEYDAGIFDSSWYWALNRRYLFSLNYCLSVKIIDCLPRYIYIYIYSFSKLFYNSNLWNYRANQDAKQIFSDFKWMYTRAHTQTQTNAHTHTHIYIYDYIYILPYPLRVEFSSEEVIVLPLASIASLFVFELRSRRPLNGCM